MSIRKGSWFERSNLTLEEILKLTYWWCRDVAQETMRFEVDVSGNTVVDWDSFCREICEVNYLECEEKIGGHGKRVQIDESKFGKRKYHRGHRVEGQWVFGGIEEGSRKSFMFAVDDRSEATLLPIIETFIEKGTTIISDCWKAYCNLEKHGYKHVTVNHSKEFVNMDGSPKLKDIGVKRRQSFLHSEFANIRSRLTWPSSFGDTNIKTKTYSKCF